MNQTKENRKYYFFIIFALTVITAFTVKFYIAKKKENQSLKLKIIMLNKDRRKPKPWGRLLAPAPVTQTSITQNKKTIEQKVSTSAAAPIRGSAPANDEDIANKTTEELANLLNVRMNRIKTFDLLGLQTTIKIADELILREPETYSPYKAKLIALLVEEGKLNISVDDNDINRLLETMAEFDLSSDAVLKKEAVLVTASTNEMNLLTERLNQITSERADIETQLESLEIDNPVYKALEARRETLASQEDEALNRLSNLQSEINNESFPEETYINEDIVQIPFMRMMAKNNYTGVLENAETFIQQFPTSTIGYYYLIRALEALGRKDEAVDVVATSRLSSSDQSLLLEKLNTTKTEDPKKYWEKLKF